MGQDVLNRVFEPFFTTKEVGKGTGMGLSMVHGIMHMFGGHIIVKSKLDTGTRFRLLFPVKELKQQVGVDKSSSVSVHRNIEAEGNILIVDDEELIAIFMNELLEMQGFNTTYKTSSEDALEIFKSNPEAFDLVITDQTMPGITGVELAKEMLKLKPDLIIILSTGFSEYIDEDKAKQFGIHNFMLKPVKASVLIEEVSKLLEIKKKNS